jgi:hypothetical protein
MKQLTIQELYVEKNHGWWVGLGLNKTCLDVQMFCNKDWSSSFNSNLRLSIATYCCDVMKVVPLSIEFWILGLSLPLNLNWSTKKDLASLSNGLVRSPSFLWNSHR